MTKPNLVMHKGIANADVRKHVDKHHDFETNNKTIFGMKGVISTPRTSHQYHYVVYSYGHHYPMYVYDYEAGKWLGNNEKSSRTTERHKYHARPTEEIHEWYDTAMMKRIINNGYIQLITQRLEGAPQ